MSDETSHIMRWIDTRISLSNTGLPSKSLKRFLSLRRTWFVLRLM